MKKIRQFAIIIGIIAIVGLATWILLAVAWPKDDSTISSKENTTVQSYKSTVHYVALGDSLTEGIGDQTNQGGYVSILTQDLKDQYPTVTFEDQNAGVAGQRSDQILARVNKDETLQEALSQADFITMSFGGNDLMKVIQQNIFSLSVKKVEEKQAAYQKQVEELLTKIRELNPQAPVYIIGIYNPFYLNFSAIEEMQTIVDDWNQATETIVKKQSEMYFIPINDLLYKGTEDQAVETTSSLEGQTSESEATTNVIKDVIENNVLSESDKFHPNKIGYQLIGKALKTEIIKTKSEWLIKE